MTDISGVIITLNEEKNIGRSIASLKKVADDILVVDSFSTDKTKQICLEHGVRFLEREFKGYGDQKNFAVSQAKHNFIISLDADEFLSEELTESILQIKKDWAEHDAYRMNRLSKYGERWIKYGNWYPDRQLRLWNRKFGRWQEKNPHERVVLDSTIKVNQLNGDLLHSGYQNSYMAILKIQLYSEIYGNENAGKKSASPLSIIVHATYAFFKCYILKRGFLDGFEGFIVSVAIANHTFYKYVKLYEKNRLLKKNN